MAEIFCLIPDCPNSSCTPKNVTLFQIPFPSIRWNHVGIKWIDSILYAYPELSQRNVFNQYICSVHFKKQFFVPPDNMKLKSFAIPTSFNSGRCFYKEMYRAGADMNITYGFPQFRIINVYSNANSVTVRPVPTTSNNTIETSSTTRNLLNNTPPTGHAGFQEPSENPVAGSSRSLRTRQIRFPCDDCK